MPIIFGGGSLKNLAIGGKRVAGIAKNGALIYQHANDKFRQLILKNSVLHEGNPDFSKVATTDEGLWAMEDDYGLSYYFRGAVENNYVKFAGFWWRIIRINGDGSIRIIYDGTIAHKNGNGAQEFIRPGIDGTTPSDDRFIVSSIEWNKYRDDAKYVGYMFGGSNGVASTSKEEATKNTTNTTIKTIVDKWYKTNIADKGLDKYVEDIIFCNDRSTPGPSATGWADDTGCGYETYATGYGIMARVKAKQPQFKSLEKNDAFTVNDIIKGNGALTYPVGLITADEVMAAGGVHGTANWYFYLYKSSDKSYWTLTPYSVNNYYHPSMLCVAGAGSLVNFTTYSSSSVAPVINLKADLNMIGTGTTSDPYRLETETL